MSDIQYLNINENFPIAGEDNDTQVFRDNFNTIKQSLQTARTEVGDLQVQTAKLIDDNDFSLNTIQNAALRNIREHFFVVTIGDDDVSVDVNYSDGPYQVITFKSDVPLNLLDFPDDTDLQETFVGKIFLEVYAEADSSITTITIPNNGTNGVTKIVTNDTPFWTTLAGDAGVTFHLTSPDDPTFIEVWRHGNTLFLHARDEAIRISDLEAAILSEENLNIVNGRLDSLEAINAESRITALENVDSTVGAYEELVNTSSINVDIDNGGYQEFLINIANVEFDVASMYAPNVSNRITLDLSNTTLASTTVTIKKTVGIDYLRANLGSGLFIQDPGGDAVFTIASGATAIIDVWTNDTDILYVEHKGIFGPTTP